jgi:CheY-like chemotaxis protein
MAKIPLVDDHPSNRAFLVTLFGYRGHHLLQAADGVEVLEVARTEHPDLILRDILMPTMDGYEFVRQLCAGADLDRPPVIFSTAHFLDQEAIALAHQCGGPFILPKPSDPATVLSLVDAALGLTSSSITSPEEAVFDRSYLRLITDQLAGKGAESEGLNDRLAALLDLGQCPVSERDPQHPLDANCPGSKEIIGANWTAVEILSDDQATVDQLLVHGLDNGMIALINPLRADQGVLGTVAGDHRPWRLQSVSGEPHLAGPVAQHPRSIHSLACSPAIRCRPMAGCVSPINWGATPPVGLTNGWPSPWPPR